MVMQEYGCYECKDWGTMEGDELCTNPECRAAARRVEIEAAATAPASSSHATAVAG